MSVTLKDNKQAEYFMTAVTDIIDTLLEEVSLYSRKTASELKENYSDKYSTEMMEGIINVAIKIRDAK